MLSKLNMSVTTWSLILVLIALSVFILNDENNSNKISRFGKLRDSEFI